jgi:DNA-binding NtrC family response regulator
MLKVRPDLPIILCSGYSSALSEEEVSGIGIKSFLLKPLQEKDIAETVRRVLDENMVTS